MNLIYHACNAVVALAIGAAVAYTITPAIAVLLAFLSVVALGWWLTLR